MNESVILQVASRDMKVISPSEYQNFDVETVKNILRGKGYTLIGIQKNKVHNCVYYTFGILNS